MSWGTLLYVAAGFVASLWGGFGVWRAETGRRMERLRTQMIEAYRAHAEAYRAREQTPPPVQWDYVEERLVPISEPEDRAEGALRATRARSERRRMPLWMYGLPLRRIPGMLFHAGFFAGVLMLLLLAASWGS